MFQFSRYLLAATGGFLLCLQGCSTFKPKTPDIAPISIETGDLISEVEFGMRVVEPVLLIRYFDDETIAEVDQFNAEWNELSFALRELLSYSVVLVQIEDAGESQQGIEDLAVNLEGLYARLKTQPTLKPILADFDLAGNVADIRSETELLPAARATLPAVNLAVRSIEELVQQTGRSLDAAADELLVRIDAYHADVIRFQDTLALRRNETIRQLELVDLAVREGDTDAWDKLRNSDMEMRSELADMGAVNSESVARAEEVLLGKLATMGKVRTSLDPDFKLYQDEILELRRVSSSVDESLIIAQLALDGWGNSHQLYVSGKKSGFARFTSELAVYAARKAAGKLL